MKQFISSDDLKTMLLTRKAILKSLIDETQKKLESAPEGTLVIARKGSRTQYYHRLDPSKKGGIYINASQEPLANLLAQKDYNKRVFQSALAEYNIIKKCLSRYPEETPENIYDHLNKQRQNLISPIREPDESFVRHWKSVSYPKMPVAQEQTSYKTPSGELMRSKSEFIIASLLAREGIPYRYEYPVNLSSLGTVHPDFTVLNIRLRKEYYWEHLGMMGDLEYTENALRKITAYQRDGYFPGESLIITYETKDRPLDIDQVMTMINKYFK